MEPQGKKLYELFKLNWPSLFPYNWAEWDNLSKESKKSWVFLEEKIKKAYK